MGRPSLFHRGGELKLADMLGNRILPNSVVSARRRVRERLSEVRRPVRQFREDNVPGPDVIGNVEAQLTELRDNFMQRESVVSSIRERRSSSSSGSSSNSGKTSRNNSEQMV